MAIRQQRSTYSQKGFIVPHSFSLAIAIEAPLCVAQQVQARFISIYIQQKLK